MSASVLFALAIGPGGYVLDTVPDDGLVSLAAHEFEEGQKWLGDAAKARPRFRQAARLYDELWRRGYRDPNLALNRANARRLAGDLPGAIVALNEGLVVARWSRPLQAALEDARSAVAYPAHTDLAAHCRPASIKTIGTRMSPFEARLITASLWCVVCVCLARFAMVRAGQWLVFAAIPLVALTILGALWLQDNRQRSRNQDHSLLVVTEDVHLRRGNSEAYPLRFESAAKLPRGVEARELTRRGGWVQIQLASGVFGWIPESAALKAGDG